MYGQLRITGQMEDAAKLRNLTLSDHKISKEDKKDFSNWLHYQNRGHGPASLHDEARGLVDLSGIDLRRPRIQQPEMASYPAPPQVTISGVTGVTSSCLSGLDSSQLHASRLMGSHPSLGGNVGGSAQQPQDSLAASLQMYARPWRSNSLTPPGCVNQQDWQPPYPPQSPKGRSHSISFEHHSNLCVHDFGNNNNNSVEDEKIDEMIRALPEGSGMRELKDWLKSLRLHKYTKVLLEFTYEELLDVTEEQLEKKGVTLGARGKIFKNINQMKERPQKIQQLADKLEDVNNQNDMASLCQVLRDLEVIVLMPTKPYNPPPPATANPIQTTSSRAMTSATRTGRHDSGSDSGTDLCHDDDSSSASGEVAKNIPGLLFDTLKRVFTIVLLSDSSNHEVITIFACLLERCRAKESFNLTQKKNFSSWLQKLRALWNPPAIRKANDYKRRSFRAPDSSRRQSVHAFTRPVVPFKPSAYVTSAINPGLPQAQVLPGHPDPHPEYAPPFSPRRSMPEIKPVTVSHFKRNSYQEDRRPTLQHRPNFFIDESEALHHLAASSEFSSGINSFGFPSPYSSSISLYNRRESADSGYLVSFPESRRDSSLSGCEFGGGHAGNASSATLINCVTDFGENVFGGGADRAAAKFSGSSGASSLFPPMTSAVGMDRRESGMSLMTASTFAEDFLSVPRGSGLPQGSMSSGCMSDGSTDSLLEQDLHNLSLAVTQQALD